MIVDIYTTSKKYKTIYADPPWKEQGAGQSKRGADAHYDLMSTTEIAELPISRLIHPEGCHLYLWTTNNFLPNALYVIEKWGFQYITTITWIKDQIGLGQYYRGLTEHCIFATTEKRLPYKVIDGKRQQGVTGFFEPKGPHSVKPDKMREMIERVSYPDRIELFARKQTKYWDTWGDQL